MDNTIEAQAQAGDIAAQMALAQQHDGGARNDLARGWYARAAKQGDVVALRRLAINLLVREPFDIPQGMAMIRDAAERGDGEAAHLCAVLAAQDTHLPNRWGVGLFYLERAAGAGFEMAQRQLQLLAAGAPIVDPTRWLTPAPAQWVSQEPRIAVAERFLSPAECDWLIARARPGLRKAEVYNPAGGSMQVDDIRSNSTAAFAMTEADLVITLLRERAARWTGLASDDFEPTTVLHYDVGEQFMQHFDFIDPELPHLAGDLARYGQRWATLLVYLNDDFEGGETNFPALGYRYRGRKGDALLFWNVTPDGQPDRRTLHAGLAPTRGEKWLLSQWMRRR